MKYRRTLHVLTKGNSIKLFIYIYKSILYNGIFCLHVFVCKTIKTALCDKY